MWLLRFREGGKGAENLSFSPSSSPAFEPVPENSHGQQQTQTGQSSHSSGGVKVLGKKIVPDVIVDEQEQEETDQDGNNSADGSVECSDGARFVPLAHWNVAGSPKGRRAALCTTIELISTGSSQRDLSIRKSPKS